MIKKLLLSSIALASFAVNAQNFKVDGIATLENGQITKRFEPSATISEKSSVAAAVVQDTLYYFFNKHRFRNPAGTGFITAVNPAIITTSTQIASFGGIFKNSGNLAVTGAEVLLSRQSNATSTSVPVGLFLYNAPSGTITGVPIASVAVAITGTLGTFVGANFAMPALVTGDYAIIAKNISAVVGDTILLWINNALTATSASTNTAAKYGEGLGVYGVLGNNFLSTTGQFGMGTDYEGIVAPRVTYSISTAAIVPTINPLCPNVSVSYTNSSSWWIGHRQYNLNQFLAQGGPFSNTATPSPAPVYSWNFGDGTPSFTTTGTGLSVPKTYTAAGTFNGTLTANVRSSSFPTATTSLSDVGNFSKVVDLCTGIQANTLNANVVTYPNPAVNGKITIANLEGNNTITVYNMLGSVISTQTTSNSNVVIDLSSQASGNYFVKITDNNNATKVVKVINQ
jgi:hypothetical protein